MIWKNDESSIIVGPYPQNPELNSIKILWETSIDTTNNSVHFGLTPDCDSIVYDNYTRNFHDIELNGLISSTKYYYKVISDTLESKIYSFYTKFEVNDSIRFVEYHGLPSRVIFFTHSWKSGILPLSPMR